MTGETEGDYEKAVELIESAKPAAEAEGMTIDIDAMLTNRMNIRSIRYSDMSKLLEGVEVTGPGDAAAAGPAEGRGADRGAGGEASREGEGRPRARQRRSAARLAQRAGGLRSP